MDFEKFSSDNNKNPGRQFLITLPTWEKVSDYKLWIDKNLPPHLYVAMCAETHKDGKNHHHIVIHTKSEISKSNLLTRFKKIFPNDYARIDVRKIRKDTINHCIDYLDKEDPHTWKHGEIPKGGRPSKNSMPREPMFRPQPNWSLTAKETEDLKDKDYMNKLHRSVEWAKFNAFMIDTQGRQANYKDNGDQSYFESFYEPGEFV